jgi:ATP-dependent Clp protease ATP-binding subunit ClpC
MSDYNDRTALLENQSKLDNIGRNLNQLAEKGIIGPIYERTEIIKELSAQILWGNSVMLIGEPGTGKNAVVEGLAGWMAKRKDFSVNKPIIECTHTTFQAYCQYASDFETKLQMIVDEMRKHQAILYYDQIHLALGAGRAQGAEDRTLANLLTPYLSRRELNIIGSTTPEGYKAILRRNPSFATHFVPIVIPALTSEQTLTVLQSLKTKFETDYSIFIEPNIFETVIDLSERFFKARFFPGKAFEVLRRVIATKSLLSERGKGIPPQLKSSDSVKTITTDDIYAYFKTQTGLPSFIIHRDENIKRQEISSFFSDRIYGQHEAIHEVTNVILNLKAEINDPKKPVGVFLFAGPTGTGKTFLAQLLAKYLFGSEDKMLRYDMSEYSAPNSFERLISGRYDQKGKLVEDVLSIPFSVILFDEIEKAHPSIFNLLLSVLGEGRLTDETGHTVSFANTIIIMTSNIGAHLYNKKQIGLNTSETNHVVENDLMKEIKFNFKPEFLNRLTKTIFFQSLDENAIRAIAQREIEKLTGRKGLSMRGIKIKQTERVPGVMVSLGYNTEYGARPMQRAVEKHIGIPIAEAIASGRIKTGETINIDFNKDNQLIIN